MKLQVFQDPAFLVNALSDSELGRWAPCGFMPTNDWTYQLARRPLRRRTWRSLAALNQLLLQTIYSLTFRKTLTRSRCGVSSLQLQPGLSTIRTTWCQERPLLAYGSPPAATKPRWGTSLYNTLQNSRRTTTSTGNCGGPRLKSGSRCPELEQYSA